ncbi:MAG: hypothetical protein GY716_16130 [bacterium]|nr:hypothetical protein [bacterium]
MRDLWNLTTLEFLRSVDRCNLWPTAKGTPIVLGRERVAALVRADRALDRPIILLGRRVAEAFGLKEADWFSWHDHVGLADGTLARNVGVHPHPAGLSRVWSDQSQAIRSSAFWVEALKRAGLTD